MISEIPATEAVASKIAVHFSQKAGYAGWGVMIGRTKNGKCGVYCIGPVAGRPTYVLVEAVADEATAREIANREWVGMGL